MKNLFLLLMLLCLCGVFPCGAQNIIPGEEWRDTDGNPINAHGGGILYHDGTYYWYGEYKGKHTYRSPGVDWDCYRTEAGGVSCYSSKDLYNWKFEGIVLDPDTLNPHSDIQPTMVIERQKVIYNDKNGIQRNVTEIMAERIERLSPRAVQTNEDNTSLPQNGEQKL